MYIKGIFHLIIVGSLALTTAALNEQDLYERFPNLDLFNSVSRSKNLIQLNTLSSTEECFEDYMQGMNDALVKYEENYKACLDASQAERTTAEEATLEQRNKLVIKSENSCSLLTQCKEVETAVAVFECYAIGGSENILAMKSISSDVSAQLADLREHYANKESKYTNVAKRTFDQEFEDAYYELNECIHNSLPVIPTRVPMGSANVKTMFDIKNVASDELGGLLEQFRFIEYRENKCTVEKKRIYDKEFAKAYDDLNDCLSTVEATPTTVTETPATDSPSSEAPVTEDYSSAVPIYSSIIIMIFMYMTTTYV